MKRLRAWWQETAGWWKSQKVEWYAGYGTAIYIGIIIMVMGARLDEFFNLKLNELGDFLAGAFGPVAFLWLVLGFLQQGRELKLSSDALRMQADELKASVQQQTALVDAQKVALENHERSLEPLLQILYVGNVKKNNQLLDVFEVINHGAYCRSVVAEFIGKGIAMAGMQVPALGKDSPQRFRATGPLPYSQVWKLQLTYEKVNGHISSQAFGMSKRFVDGLDVYAVFEEKAFIDDIEI